MLRIGRGGLLDFHTAPWHTDTIFGSQTTFTGSQLSGIYACLIPRLHSGLGMRLYHAEVHQGGDGDLQGGYSLG